MVEKIRILDTTLRDGEQSPGATMDTDDKVFIAHALQRLGVDVIEAGFPASSAHDFRAVQRICKEVKNVTVSALARCTEKDIDAAGKALESASSKQLFMFIAVSPMHMQYKLRSSPKEVCERLTSMITYAKKYTDDIRFAFEDATRADRNFLCLVTDMAIKAGATSICIPDTVGYMMPSEYGALIRYLINNVTNSDQAIFSLHCHNDLSMAVANSLAGLENGAMQVECCVNGIGERAGNAALEEVVMAIKTRQDYFNFDCNINTRELMQLSKALSLITGLRVSRNKPIVGENAFAHEAGIHQAGVLENPEIYEIINPDDVGWDYERIVLGRHSGISGLRYRLSALNLPCDDDKLNKDLLCEIKKLPKAHSEIDDQTLKSLYSHKVGKD